MVFRVNMGTQIDRDDQIQYEFATLKLLENSGVTPVPYFVDDTRTFFERGIGIMAYLPGPRPGLHHRSGRGGRAVGQNSPGAGPIGRPSPDPGRGPAGSDLPGNARSCCRPISAPNWLIRPYACFWAKFWPGRRKRARQSNSTSKTPGPASSTRRSIPPTSSSIHPAKRYIS